MSTPAVVHFKDGDLDSDTIVTMYRHHDGFPDRLGVDIFESVKTQFEAVGMTAPLPHGPGHSFRPFYGMACLTAFLVGQLKGGTLGSVYLYPPDSEGVGERYVYTIYVDENNDVCMLIDGEGGPLHNFDPITATFTSGDRAWQVTASDGYSQYDVIHVVEKWTCTCMDHIMRNRECKHIRRIKGK